MLAFFEEFLLAQNVRHTGARFSAFIVFAVLHFATIIAKPHGMRSILTLTSVNLMLSLRLSEAQTY